MTSIPEILKLKGDKDAFISEGGAIAVEGGGTYKNYDYLIALNSLGHRCGYVSIPDSHPYSQVKPEMRGYNGKEWEYYDYSKLEIDCHGGITFMSPRHGLKNSLANPAWDMWIGFDCGHLWDKSDVEAILKYFGEEAVNKIESFFNATGFEPTASVKSYNYAKSECKHIIEQLIQNEEVQL